MIYIVEDDAAIRELEQYALQSSGYEVTSFESSEPFWQAMHAAEPELVILDVMLPGEDFGRRHQCRLPAGLDGDQGRQGRHHGLAAAHVALQQAVHRV